MTPYPFTIGVGIDGLLPMGVVGPGFEVDTSSLGHDNNNQFARPDMIGRLLSLPDHFRDQAVRHGVPLHQVPNLVYTAMSLPRGGVFDVDANEDGQIDNPWRPPHHLHRFGTDADLRVNNIPRHLRDELETAVLTTSLFFAVRKESPENPTANHWHLRTR